MGPSAAERLGKLPNAAGTVTRLAYAHAKARRIDMQALLQRTSLTLQQIDDPSLSGGFAIKSVF